MRINWGKVGLSVVGLMVVLPFVDPGVRLRVENFFDVMRARSYLEKVAAAESGITAHTAGTARWRIW